MKKPPFSPCFRDKKSFENSLAIAADVGDNAGVD